MDRTLNALSTEFLPLAVQLLARLVERGVMVLIVQTLRTPEEAAQNLANGTSATTHSKHLPRRLRHHADGSADDERADAMDLCPYDVYQLAGPDTLQWSDDVKGHAAFAAIGEEAERLGLRWGGRWSSPHDPGHVELLFAGERYPDIPATAPAAAMHRSQS
jgi:peptidoglycan L-alanyl-D-glutamate endopeptidase CwlK